jgi:hypothetical protein
MGLFEELGILVPNRVQRVTFLHARQTASIIRDSSVDSVPIDPRLIPLWQEYYKPAKALTLNTLVEVCEEYNPPLAAVFAGIPPKQVKRPPGAQSQRRNQRRIELYRHLRDSGMWTQKEYAKAMRDARRFGWADPPPYPPGHRPKETPPPDTRDQVDITKGTDKPLARLPDWYAGYPVHLWMSTEHAARCGSRDAQVPAGTMPAQRIARHVNRALTAQTMRACVAYLEAHAVTAAALRRDPDRREIYRPRQG